MTAMIATVCILTGLIHCAETLSYSLRLAGVRTGKLAVSLSLTGILLLVSRTANMVQSPLAGGLIDRARAEPGIPLKEGYHWIIMASSVGTALAIILFPSFVLLFSRMISHLETAGSLPRMMTSVTVEQLRSIYRCSRPCYHIAKHSCERSVKAVQRRPELKDYPEHIVRYLKQVPEGDLLSILREQTEEMLYRLSSLTEEESLYRYAPGKWSIRQLVGHIADTEQVFAYRLLRAARNDRTPLPGFDENQFVDAAFFDEQPMSILLGRLEASRRTLILLMESLKEKEWNGKATVNGFEGTALSWACVLVGHAAHHMDVLKERYQK